MAHRDRLQALRAKRDARDSPSNERHELTPVNGNDTNGGTGMPAFYAEVTSIHNALQQFDTNVSRISDLHSRSLNVADESTTHQNAAQLDELVEETRSLSKSLRERTKALAAFPGTAQDAQQRKNQSTLLQRKFIESLQNYQQVEAQYRDRYKQRVERQFKIVKPDATREEINAVVNDDRGGGGEQIFAQALSTSDHYGQSRAAYKEVQERHQDIRKIEQTFGELNQLIADMSVLVAQQDDTINVIETSASKVEGDTEAGLKHTNVAVEHARSARKKRIICFVICLIIIAILALVLGIGFGASGWGKSKSN
ncbi:hypothetical protein PLICRDRAFT_698997 [Plicaturopsis crispa FD-325 SS-3]|nr:hypothetical protein PLICRDRAFT_698997 [Plicaturopsis crispa FD-325 SS-3]